ncbi:unnamed protein product, partial [marine sediment metagenome]
LKLGRHFPSGKSLIIVGRREEENLMLVKTAKRLKLPYMEVKDFMGPTTLLLGKPSKAALKKAAGLTVRYSDSPKGKVVELVLKRGKGKETITARPISDRELENLRQENKK